jgi:bifunctional enzyme CysN/CysC
MSAEAAVAAFVAAQQDKSLLRFITCGSVDDGKSTLIGRLLYDSQALFADQVAALEATGRHPGRSGGTLDFASVVDGLADEQAQGITIDVAYRFFATQQRKFIIADTPGHEHYTRNMVTGASTADAAVILVDAAQGVVEQTRRHSLIVRLLGIRTIVLAVNKMDLLGYRQEAFDRIAADYRALADAAGIPAFTAIPTAALHGDNVVSRSAAMPWYGGPTLLEHLEQVPVAAGAAAGPFRMAVQSATRGEGELLCAGTIVSGAVSPGDRLGVLPKHRPATVRRIVTMDGDLACAQAGQAVTLAVDEDSGAQRGDLICAPSGVPPVTDQLEATVVWLTEAPYVAGQAYGLKLGTRTVAARLDVSERIDVNTGRPVAGTQLNANDIGNCILTLDAQVAAVPYAQSRALGGFILIDQSTNATIAAGMIH